jgi:N12 class adenine-specific DNA methylase
MLDRIIANAIYLVPARVNKFKKQHLEEEVLIADATKARKVKSNQQARYEMGWVIARRGVLMLTTTCT